MSASSLDRDRLAKLLGMLGSDHDGEILAAARQAERLRSEARLTWADILAPALQQPPRPQQHSPTPAQVVDFVLDHAEVLTDWEINFAKSIRHQRSRLSPKQREVLDRPVEKAHRAEARAA
jgi:hypothetical protein